MKPLNRPMFRYGGPIKEGIMSGMQDRPGYSAAGRVGGFLLGQLPKIKNFFRSKPSITGGGQGITGKYTPAPLTRTEKIKQFFQTAPAGQIIAKDPLVKFTTGGGKVASKVIKPLVKGAFTTPSGLLLTGATLTDILPGGKPFGPDKFLPNILGQRFDEQGNKIPGTGFFNPDKVEKGETEGMKRVEEIGAGEGTTGGSVTDDPNKAKQIQEDRIEKTKKRYYELMGIDKMKKDAAYDSLIDASKIVQQEGADLKGAIKSGALQTQIINAISKNLDKSADIKRQIDAAILKGEIQKDIASADSVDKDLKKARIKQLERAEKNASASGQIAAVKSEKGFVPGATTAAILRNDNIKYDTILQDKLITDFKEDNPTKDEVDYIISLGTELPDGRYVVGERLVEKKGNEVAFIV
jgi:hypothetical protein